MLESRKAMFPLLVEGARPPDAEGMPQEPAALLRYQALAIDNGDGGVTSSLLIREIEAVIQHVDVGSRVIMSPSAAGRCVERAS